MARKSTGNKSQNNKSSSNKPRNYWLLVLSPSNFQVTREREFTLQAVGSRERRKAQRMVPHDRVLFYVTGIMCFPATATITSEYFEDRTPDWVDPGSGEPYPYRVHMRPEVVLEEARWVDAREVGPRMEYVKRWTPEHWPLAFLQAQLHLLPQRDFNFIEEEMKKVARKRASRVGR